MTTRQLAVRTARAAIHRFHQTPSPGHPLSRHGAVASGHFRPSARRAAWPSAQQMGASPESVRLEGVRRPTSHVNEVLLDQSGARPRSYNDSRKTYAQQTPVSVRCERHRSGRQEPPAATSLPLGSRATQALLQSILDGISQMPRPRGIRVGSAQKAQTDRRPEHPTSGIRP